LDNPVKYVEARVYVVHQVTVIHDVTVPINTSDDEVLDGEDTTIDIGGHHAQTLIISGSGGFEEIDDGRITDVEWSERRED
tara:strand:- start:1014 stop:1256 length:243 start_codon:yes stop_codon:yes gene_type:complete